MIDPLEQEGLEEEGLNDNIIRINGRFFPNDRYPNPFDRLIAAVYARELDENIALTSSNIKQSKRESVKNKDGEIISEHVHLGFPYAADHFHIVLLQITTINTPDKLFLKPDNCLELGIFEKEIPC